MNVVDWDEQGVEVGKGVCTRRMRVKVYLRRVKLSSYPFCAAISGTCSCQVSWCRTRTPSPDETRSD